MIIVVRFYVRLSIYLIEHHHHLKFYIFEIGNVNSYVLITNIVKRGAQSSYLNNIDIITSERLYLVVALFKNDKQFRFAIFFNVLTDR